jgi:NitT/TauT family transport system ATP-binding protein
MTTALSIDFQHVALSYGTTEAIADVTFSVAEPAIVSLVGPSGCGKTTVLMVAAGLRTPTAGEFVIGGDPLVRGDIGFAFQDPVLLPWRTATENVELLRDLHIPMFGSAHEALNAVGLAGSEAKYPDALSGGMKQRAALARVLAQSARLWLMDEPFAALDEFTRTDLTLLLRRLWLDRRITTLFVTHSIVEAVMVSDIVVVLSARPARVLEVVRVPLDERRTVDSMEQGAFTDTVHHIRQLLYADR